MRTRRAWHVWDLVLGAMIHGVREDPWVTEYVPLVDVYTFLSLTIGQYTHLHEIGLLVNLSDLRQDSKYSLPCTLPVLPKNRQELKPLLFFARLTRKDCYMSNQNVDIVSQGQLLLA